MPEEYRPIGHLFIAENLTDPDPDQLQVAADLLEWGGFTDLARIFRETKLQEYEYVVEGWVRIGNMLHYAQRNSDTTCCGRTVTERAQHTIFSGGRTLCRTCHKQQPRLKGKSLVAGLP